MIDINNALEKLNVLSSKKNKNNIDKLIDLIKIDQKTNKSFSSEITSASSVSSTISIQIIFEKIIKSFIETFKIMHFSNARAVIVDEIQKILNVILYRQSIVLLVNVSIDFEQISIQVVQINTFNSRNYYNCAKSEHRINNCSEMNQLMNNDLIYFNERRRIYFDRAEQEETKMRL